MKQKDRQVKTPPRGGDAAAAWDHNLTDEQKALLVQEQKNLQARRLKLGKTVVIIIIIINAVLAVISFTADFNLTLLCARLLMCLALYLSAPGIKPLFVVGAIAAVIMISGRWMTDIETETYISVLSIIDTACLVVSSLILLTDENVSDYLYKKRYG